MTRWGIRLRDATGTVTIKQIAGNGRMKLCNGSREWWTRKIDGPLEVYQTNSGQTYESEAEAEEVARTIKGG